MRVAITGVPGVGKTSVCRGLQGFAVVNFGDFMFEIAKETFNIKNRDEMRKKLSVSDYVRLQKIAGRRISEMENVVVDTHCSVELHGGYYPGLPSHLLKTMKLDALIVIEADVRDIVERRKKDAGIRQRSLDEEDVRRHQEMNRYYAAACSELSGVPVFFVKNRHGKLEETIEEVKKILNRL